MNIADLIPEYRSEINNGLADIYPRGPISLTKPVAYVLNGGGKRLRPLLTIFSAEACGGTKSSVFSAALAVEVLHNFTLVHDDIMDQDSIRHGQETVHNKWDDGVAILTGDAMLSLALRLLNETPVESHLQMKIFIDGLLAVCEGQALDKEFENQSSVSLDDYIKMIDLKTGHLIGLAAELGAVSTGMDSKICEKVRDYGNANQPADGSYEDVKLNSYMVNDLSLNYKIGRAKDSASNTLDWEHREFGIRYHF